MRGCSGAGAAQGPAGQAEPQGGQAGHDCRAENPVGQLRQGDVFDGLPLPAPPADRVVLEAEPLHLVRGVKVSPVNDDPPSERRPDPAEVGVAIRMPLGEDEKRRGPVKGGVARLEVLDGIAEDPARLRDRDRIVDRDPRSPGEGAPRS